MNNNAYAHSPTLRRAVIRARPDFYSLSEAEQLGYRMQMPDTDRFALERSVFRELYGVDCDSVEALRAAWDDLPIGELDAINETLLSWHGIGEDCFYLNEFVADADRLRWTTLDDYVRDDHAFQESGREKDFTDYTATPYQGNLHGCWARLFIDGRFRYATLTRACCRFTRHRVATQNCVSQGAERRPQSFCGQALQRRMARFWAATRRAGGYFSAIRRCSSLM